jgi:hypothetical protein
MKIRSRNKLTLALSLATMLALLLVPLALADSISGDADALVLETPHANSLTATQNGGTTVAYDFSAVIKNTGNIGNDVFPGSVTASITRGGAWQNGGSPASFTFTEYDVPKAGVVEITVPCGSAGTTKTMTVDLDAGTRSNGESLSPNSVHLSYLITAGPDDPSCAPSVATPPIIEYTLDPAIPDGNNGWYRSDVTLTWTVTESESPETLVTTGCKDQNITTDQHETNYSCSASSDSGSAGPVTVSIKRDATTPTISGSASPAANGYGWNNTDVDISFTCDDNMSGVASCGPDQTLSSEGVDQSVIGAAVDNAGNIASATVSGINIDKTAPTVTLVGGPAVGGSYYFGFVPAAPTCSASDALSGLEGSCSVSGYSAAVGNHTVTASATDKAGNSASDSASYTVLAWTLTGFYQPVDMNGVLNLVKNGGTVPLKFEIFAGPTELTDPAYVKSLTYAQTSCDANATSDEIETTATGGTSLRYDTSAGQFVYNWKTPNTAGKCYRVSMMTLDGSSLQAYFKLK